MLQDDKYTANALREKKESKSGRTETYSTTNIVQKLKKWWEATIE